MSPRIGRGTGFAKWPALVGGTKSQNAEGAEIWRGAKPRVLPGRLYMNKRGRWVVPA